MTLLSIFHTGGLTLALSLVALVLETIFVSQIIKEQKAYKAEGGHKELHKTMFFKFAAAVFVLYIIAMLVVASDYKGV